MNNPITIPPIQIDFRPMESVTADPWHLANYGIKAQAERVGGGAGVKWGIVDTGIASHPDLQNIAKSKDFTGGNNPADRQSHGTHVAGIIAGAKTGYAPNCQLYIAKGLDDNGSGAGNWIGAGIDWLIAEGVDGINLSLGSPYPDRTIEAAIRRAHAAGIVVCAATGNDSASNVSYPANFDEICLGVGAIDEREKRATFSNAGQAVDVVGPGVNIISCRNTGGYIRMSGTSMATPAVSGLIALLIAGERKSGRQLKNANDLAAYRPYMKDLGRGGWDVEYGDGLLNIGTALDAILDSTDPKPPTPPDGDNGFSIGPFLVDAMTHLGHNGVFVGVKL